MSKRRVWAPRATKVDLVTAHETLPMRPDSGGWWRIELKPPLESVDYAFSLDGGEPRPDPRSRFQPHGVHGFSRPVDFGIFKWTDANWRPPPLSAAIIYELHIGTFSDEGTFDSAIAKLEYLVDLGITHIELMPIAEYSGDRNWGYDGVDLFAPHHAYGGPAGLMRLVDACHSRGLAVIIDVVYNHFGPDGAYFAEFGPYLTDRYRTPWGAAINLDDAGSDEVRRFLCDSALAWLRDYHCDGLRIDAVHAIFDASAIHFLEQLASEVRLLEASVGKPIALIAESDLNQPAIVTPVEAGGYGINAQWNDDFHHAIHSLISDERSGYYMDFGTLAHLARAFTDIFVFTGQFSEFRHRKHGRPVKALSADRFVGFLQNHDQVGNRACGERLGHIVDLDLLQMAAAMLLTGPFTPMLFQGEEWNASSPFLYFTSYRDEALAEAVRKGRRAEFEHFHQVAEVPDPQALNTFARSKLRWDEREQGEHARTLSWYKCLIRLRRELKDLVDPRRESISVEYDESARWLLERRGHTFIAFNFAPERRTVPIPKCTSDVAEIVLASKSDVHVGIDAIELPPRTVAILVPKGR
jgi:maltooligosyltrehalose trehalohydrolase